MIIPAFCAAKYIGKTLESVLGQSYQNIEVLVVDDGSTDETYDIVRQFTNRDRRVIVLKQSNQGTASARNLAISHASGELIAPIDADDVWLPQCLERQVAAMLDSNSKVGVVYAWSFDIDHLDRSTGRFHSYAIEGDVYTTLLCHNFLGNASCTMIRSSCLKDVGLYTREFREAGIQGCEDWELCVRIAAKYKFKVVPEFLVAYRKTAQSMSRSFDSMAASHTLLLQCAQRSASVPMPVRLLSTSSFYVYLASQCSEVGRNADALLWLKRALCTECVTTLLRFAVYCLVAQSLARIFTGKASSGSSRSANRCSTTVPDRRNIILWWRKAIGNALHNTMQFCFERARKKARNRSQEKLHSCSVFSKSKGTPTPGLEQPGAGA